MLAEEIHNILAEIFIDKLLQYKSAQWAQYLLFLYKKCLPAPS